MEAAKLSLYLKLLENKGGEAAGNLFKHTVTALLPSLEENIKCGNSLVGADFYAQIDLGLSDDDRIKVNCFDWEKELPVIFKADGFDVVGRNPPYTYLGSVHKVGYFAGRPCVFSPLGYENAFFKAVCL